MGLLQRLGLRPPSYLPPDPQVMAAPIIDFVYQQVLDQDPEELWRGQPHIRTVIDFLARNIAQLGIHAYKHVDDGGRERVRTGFLPKMLARPNDAQTGYELIFELVADLALYDHAYWLISATGDHRKYEIRSLRPHWVVRYHDGDPWNPGDLVVRFPGETQETLIPRDRLLVFHGWSPSDSRRGVSPIESLRSILAEQIQSSMFREQMWRNGGRVGSYLTRPKDAPAWTNEDRKRFMDHYRAAYSGSGSQAGGTPLLEDGIEMRRVGFSAKEEQWVESNKLALQTVASVYHINPTMVGLLDNANYSNVREFRRMLYGETLGPVIKMVEERLNGFLLPRLNLPDSVYVEFNTESRLRGSFEEQAAVMQTSIGGPWMTINEGRARQNLPAVDNGDRLIRPLNLAQNGDQDSIPADPDPADDATEDPDADEE